MSTAVLCYFKEAYHEQHLVFFYLFPLTLVATLYGFIPTALSAFVATLAAAYFLYEPIYSFRVAGPVQLGELVLFAVTALIGGKCAAELTCNQNRKVTSFIGKMTRYESQRQPQKRQK